MIWRGLTKDDKQWTYIMLRGEKGKVKYTDIPEERPRTAEFALYPCHTNFIANDFAMHKMNTMVP